MRNLRFLTFVFLALSAVLSGCTTYVENVVSEEFEPIFQETEEVVEATPTGAIYSSNGQGFFPSTRRNKQVGDIINVTMLETFSATKSNSAASSKSDAFDVTMPTGLPNILTGGFEAGQLTSGTAQTFSGSGTASQSNTLSGSMSVTVLRVYANGNLESTSSDLSAKTWNDSSLSVDVGGYSGGSSHVSAKIPIIRIYDQTLSASQVQQNFNALSSRYGL